MQYYVKLVKFKYLTMQKGFDGFIFMAYQPFVDYLKLKYISDSRRSLTAPAKGE